MDPVATETIIELVKVSGSEAFLDGEMLTIYPKDGNPVAYRVPNGGLGRRLIIEIGKRTGIPSHWFWHPERAQDAPVLTTTTTTTTTTQSPAKAPSKPPPAKKAKKRSSRKA